MPGLLAFGRRWSVGSDDLIVPALFLIVFNTLWVIISACAIPTISVEQASDSDVAATGNPEDIEIPNELHLLRLLLSTCVAVLVVCVLCEGAIAYVSTRGSIINREQRNFMPYLVYLRTGILLIQVVLVIVSTVWLCYVYPEYFDWGATKILIGITVWQLIVILISLLITWCTYDISGREWVNLTRYRNKQAQRVIASYPGGGSHRLSDTRNRNWRKRHFQLAYRNRWQRRMRLFICCLGNTDSDRDSFGEIAKLFSDFFTDFDIVATDVAAGLVLLRMKQKRARQKLIEKADNDTYEFLSGAAITPETEFLDLTKKDSLKLLEDIRYYMQFALAVYGWSFYLSENRHGKCCKLLSAVRCCGCVRQSPVEHFVEKDNCCFCDSSALRLTLPEWVQISYANFHCGVFQTPFFIAVDHDRQNVVLCLRGTLSLRDLMTDLCAASEAIPFDEKFAAHRSGWQAHHGIIKAALYIQKILDDEKLLEKAFTKLKDGGRLLIVGHSLGGGTAAVLGLMLRDRPQYANLHAYVFSPPGGLMTRSAAEECAKFMTGCVVGKDVVPRLGLAQMEVTRHELIALWKTCKDTKWKVIAHGLPFCRSPLSIDSDNEPSLLSSDNVQDDNDSLRDIESAPALLTSHGQRLYPPGRILHVVRTWTKSGRASARPDYAAIWTDCDGFEEILISPVMIHDHMPGGVIDGLDKLLEHCRLKQREQSTQTESSQVVRNGAKYSTATSATGNYSSVGSITDEEEKRPVLIGGSTPIINEGDEPKEITDDSPHIFVGRTQSSRELNVKEREKRQDGRSVHFIMGPTASSEQMIKTMYEKQDPQVEQAWTDFFSDGQSSCHSFAPDSASLRVGPPSIYGGSELAESTDPSPSSVRAVATFAGELAAADTSNDDLLKPTVDTGTDLGKARSETYLNVKDDTVQALHRSEEEEDVRLVGLQDDNHRELTRSPEIEDLTEPSMV